MTDWYNYKRKDYRVVKTVDGIWEIFFDAGKMEYYIGYITPDGSEFCPDGIYSARLMGDVRDLVYTMLFAEQTALRYGQQPARYN